MTWTSVSLRTRADNDQKDAGHRREMIGRSSRPAPLCFGIALVNAEVAGGELFGLRLLGEDRIASGDVLLQDFIHRRLHAWQVRDQFLEGVT